MLIVRLLPTLALILAAGSAFAQTPPRKPAPADTAQASPAAPAPVSAAPQTTTATYGDWVLRCERIGEGDKAQRVCEVAQTLQAQGQGTLAQLAISHAANGPYRMVAVAPTNVSFPSVMRFAVDDKDAQPVELPWKRCIPVGCVADGEIKEDILKRWRAQAERGLIGWKAGGGQDVSLPFSFRGLNQALEALAKA